MKRNENIQANPVSANSAMALDSPEVAQRRTKANSKFIGHRRSQTAKKWGLGVVGASAAIMGANSMAGTTMQTQSPATTVVSQPAAASASSTTGDGPFDATKKHDRWVIKTSVSSNSTLANTVTAQVNDLAKLQDLPTSVGNAKQFPASFISQTAANGMHEGQMVQTDCYIHLVAFEVDDDSDYHIQVNQNPTNNVTDLSPCLIVEVPHPLATSDPELSQEFADARKLLRDNCFGGAIPTGTVSTPLHVRITGQLFYDLSHAGSSDPGGGRGKTVNGTRMKATTIWELHPVTNIEILP